MPGRTALVASAQHTESPASPQVKVLLCTRGGELCTDSETIDLKDPTILAKTENLGNPKDGSPCCGRRGEPSTGLPRVGLADPL